MLETGAAWNKLLMDEAQFRSFACLLIRANNSYPDYQFLLLFVGRIFLKISIYLKILSPKLFYSVRFDRPEKEGKKQIQ